MCKQYDGQTRSSQYQANSILKASSSKNNDRKMEVKCYIKCCAQVASHKIDAWRGNKSPETGFCDIIRQSKRRIAMDWIAINDAWKWDKISQDIKIV